MVGRWICPKCKWEFPRERRRCVLCNVPLVKSTGSPLARATPRIVKLVEVFRTRDPVQLQIAEATLRCGGIRHVTSGETASALFGSATFFVPGARLEVAKKDVPRAKRAIERAFHASRRLKRDNS